MHCESLEWMRTYQEKEQLLSDIRARIDDWQSMAETAKSEEASSKKEAPEASGAVMRQLALGEVGLTGLEDDDDESNREESYESEDEQREVGGPL